MLAEGVYKYKREDASHFTRTQSLKSDPNLIIGKEIGKPFFEYRKKWEKAARFELITDYPLQLDFELNTSCNLRCKMCVYSYKKPSTNNNLFSFKRYHSIINSGVKKGLCSVNLNYINEPLLREDIVDFISLARHKGILDVMLNTNGTLLSPDFSEKLIKSGLTRINISIDAFREQTYNKIRKGGNFEKVKVSAKNLVNIRNAMKLRLPLVSVSFVKIFLNRDELEDFINYWNNVVDYISIQKYLNPFLSRDIIPEMKIRLRKKIRHFRCPMPWQRMVVRYDGSFLPCCTFYGAKLPLGNIKEFSVEEIWKNRKMSFLRKMHKEKRYFEEPVCKSCALNSFLKL